MYLTSLPSPGHAFETRIYAENVPRGFLPAAGRLHHLRTPSDLPGAVRVETGVRESDVISTYYDPMIAKLVVWGKDRGAALVKLRQALGEYQVRRGVTSWDDVVRWRCDRSTI